MGTMHRENLLKSFKCHQKMIFGNFIPKSDLFNDNNTYNNLHFSSPLFKELRLSGEKHIILDYEVEHITHILKQADEVHFMGDYQSYVIINLVSENYEKYLCPWKQFHDEYIGKRN